jgi:hypothetical protein
MTCKAYIAHHLDVMGLDGIYIAYCARHQWESAPAHSYQLAQIRKQQHEEEQGEKE